MTFIRPLYTCGAFNRKVQRAVMYNTARGTCYTFEDVSALLVNEVLAGKRECPIDTTHIAEVTGTTEEQVAAFFHESRGSSTERIIHPALVQRAMSLWATIMIPYLRSFELL